MRIKRIIRQFHRDHAGTASFEFMLIFPVMMFIFFMAYNWTLHIRERVEIRSAVRTSAWSVMSFGETFGDLLPCSPLTNGLPLPSAARLRGVRCERKIEEERPSTKPYWEDMKTVVGSGAFERSLVTHVEPEPLMLTAARGYLVTSPAADLIGVVLNPFDADGYGLPDWWNWSHDEETFEGGHDDVVFKELKKKNTHKLFPDIYRKAQ